MQKIFFFINPLNKIEDNQIKEIQKKSNQIK